MDWDYNKLKTDREYRGKFYRSTEFRNKRQEVFKENPYETPWGPFCRFCLAKGIKKMAKIVDHIEDIQVSPKKLMDMDNLQPLCIDCHKEKTAATTNNPKSTGIVNSAIDFDLI